ncbi:MAG: sugar phosphate isomerase/epimerase family protein [Christensenellales bacterium]
MYKSASLGAIGVKVGLLEGIELAARHGFQGIDINPFAAEEVGIERVRQALQKHNLKNAGFGLPRSFESASKEEYEKGKTELKRMAEIARKLDAFGCSTYIVPFSNTMTYKTQFDFLAERLGGFSEILREFGFRMGLEYVGARPERYRAKHGFISNIPEMLELCDAIDGGYTGLLVDVYHTYTAGHDMDIIKTLNPERITLVHVNDARLDIGIDYLPDTKRTMPGETGVIDICRFMNNLKGIGYQGPVAAEPFSSFMNLFVTENEWKMEYTIRALNMIWPE